MTRSIWDHLCFYENLKRYSQTPVNESNLEWIDNMISVTFYDVYLNMISVHNLFEDIDMLLKLSESNSVFKSRK